MVSRLFGAKVAAAPSRFRKRDGAAARESHLHTPASPGLYGLKARKVPQE